MTAQIRPNPTLSASPLHRRERTQKQPRAGEEEEEEEEEEANEVRNRQS